MPEIITTILNFAKPFLIAYGIYAGIVALFSLVVVIIALATIISAFRRIHKR